MMLLAANIENAVYFAGDSDSRSERKRRFCPGLPDA